MNAKEYLLSKGKIDAITRGRISRDNHAFLLSEVQRGIKIDGYTPVEVTKASGEKSIKNTQKVSTEKVVSDLPPERYFEESTEAYAFVDGKKHPVGMRTVCNTCGVSFTYHYCNNPKAYVHNQSVDVTFTKRTTPLKRFY